jgi:hypothetical protein
LSIDVPLDNAGFSNGFPSYDHNPHTKRPKKKTISDGLKYEYLEKM